MRIRCGYGEQRHVGGSRWDLTKTGGRQEREESTWLSGLWAGEWGLRMLCLKKGTVEEKKMLVAGGGLCILF
jgi:hypothetical protein